MAKSISTENILQILDQEDSEDDDIEDLLGEESSGADTDLEDEMPPQDVIPRHRIPQEETASNFYKGRSNPVAGPYTRPQYPAGQSDPVARPSTRPQFPAGRSNPVAGPSTRPQYVAGRSNPVAGRSNPVAGPTNPVARPSTGPQYAARPQHPTSQSIPVAAPSAPVAGPSIPAQRAPGLGLVDPSVTRAVPAEIRAGRRRRKKKINVVKNIQDTLDENNYDAYEIPRDKKEFSVSWKPTNFPKRTDNWVNQKTVFSNDKEEHEIIKGEVGEVVGRARGATSPLLAWECFFDQKMLSIIVQRTNESIGRARDGMKPHYLNDPNVNYIHYTDDIEIRALIGLIYWRGLLGMQNHNVKHMFGEDGHHFFGGTMAKNRFTFLLQHLSFDDKLTRDERWPTDRFAAIREIFECFNANCSRSVAPGLHLSIDETLAATRLKTLFTVYNPAKPAKYGILYRSINSVEVPYTHSVIVMAGKPENTEGARYYTNSVIGSVERLIMNLKRYQQIDGRIITTDNLYTSVQMADVFLQHNISTVGTMRVNSGGVPKEFKDTKTRAKNSYQVLFKKDKNYITLHSYVVQTKSKKEPKNIIMLSSMKSILGTSKEDRKKQKPAIIEFYNFTKGNINILHNHTKGGVIKRSRQSHVRVTSKSRQSHVKVTSKSCQSHVKVTSKSRQSNVKVTSTSSQSQVKVT